MNVDWRIIQYKPATEIMSPSCFKFEGQNLEF